MSHDDTCERESDQCTDDTGEIEVVSRGRPPPPPPPLSSGSFLYSGHNNCCVTTPTLVREVREGATYVDAGDGPCDRVEYGLVSCDGIR